MKFLIAIVGLVAFSVLASDASAQGGSRGVKGRFVAKEYTVTRAVRVPVVRESIPRLRLAWVPRRVAAPAGSNGTNVSVQVGGSNGSGMGSQPINYAAPAVEQNTQIKINSGSSIQQHSLKQAASNRMFHSRGPWSNGARYEGVGFSTRSAQAALENCCYYGQKPLVEQSVIQGQSGWYATARYR